MPRGNTKQTPEQKAVILVYTPLTLRVRIPKYKDRVNVRKYLDRIAAYTAVLLYDSIALVYCSSFNSRSISINSGRRCCQFKTVEEASNNNTWYG